MNEAPIIARKLFFGNPDRSSVQISPDGASISWLAPVNGVLNAWVASRDDLASARPLTHDTARGIRNYCWAYSSRQILFTQDNNGDENWRLYAADVHTGSVKDLTPFDGVNAHIVATNPKYPEEVVAGLNNRKPEWHDIYRVNTVTGELTLLLQHDRFCSVLVDNDYRIRGAYQMTADGGLDLFVPVNGDWRLRETIPPEDMMTTGPIGFDKTNERLIVKDSRGRNTAALVEVDYESRSTRILAEDPLSDADDILRHPADKHIQAVSFNYDRKRWQILDESIEPDLAYLRTVSHGDVEITSRSLDDRFWLIAFLIDDGPARYYLYEREKRHAAFLFTNRAALEGLALAKMRPVVIKSRDGLDLVAYYTLPVGCDADGNGIPDRPMPMIFTPHGGPWWRDSWGYDAWNQWLANRGYVVLSVNFRASTGFGKAFLNAGDREWGGKIIEDQVDAVQWAIAAGIADPNRVAVMGASFGGYSTLAGLTFNPELFACGVDLVGIANLVSWMESIPAYWKPVLNLLVTRVGDPSTEDGRALLVNHSPLTFVDRICRPLLIGQGANDPRVRQAEPDQIVSAMHAKKFPVTYVVYPDEGHGFARPENNLSFYAISEAFLARHLGGRSEPIGGDFEGASLDVLTGANEVPGLDEAIDKRLS
ncbi:MAG: S9 family peptidase [Capsulimonadaceae bacterium]|nr:S9 family peptidase [Capsulimonadaceae bacterium]